MLALNATAFVALLRTANLSHYVDDEHDGQRWTILAPRDDIITGMEEDDPSELERVLRYHFIPGKLTSSDLVDGALLGTELREDGLDGGRQRLRVSVKNNGGIEPDANGEVGFGNARVISDPSTCCLALFLALALFTYVLISSRSRNRELHGIRNFTNSQTARKCR